MSTKKAPTRGRMMKAVGAGPWDLVTVVMLAIAVGVAPSEKPATTWFSMKPRMMPMV